jgi:hypothetical protein
MIYWYGVIVLKIKLFSTGNGGSIFILVDWATFDFLVYFFCVSISYIMFFKFRPKIRVELALCWIGLAKAVWFIILDLNFNYFII